MVIDSKDPNSYEIFKIGGTAGDQAFGIEATNDGGFIVGGWTASKAGYLTHSKNQGITWSDSIQLWQASNGTTDNLTKRISTSGSDIAIVKINADGNMDFCTLHNYAVTEKAFNITTPSERMEGMAIDKDGDIIITGYGAVAKNVQNAVIAKFSGKDGTLLWHRSAGNKDMTTIPEDSADYIKASY